MSEAVFACQVAGECAFARSRHSRQQDDGPVWNNRVFFLRELASAAHGGFMEDRMTVHISTAQPASPATSPADPPTALLRTPGSYAAAAFVRFISPSARSQSSNS